MPIPEQLPQLARDKSQHDCANRHDFMPARLDETDRSLLIFQQIIATRVNRVAKLFLATVLVLTYVQPTNVDAQTRFQSAIPSPEHALSGMQLVESLRKGGLVVYFRHAAIEMDGKAPPNCRGTTLSPKGRAEAEFIGQQFTRLGIKAGKVLSSPSCRTMDHARISFGEFEPVEYVFGEMNNFDKLAERLTAEFSFQGNLVVIGHISGMKSIAGTPPLEYSEAIIIRPGANAVIVARLKLDDWQTLGN